MVSVVTVKEHSPHDRLARSKALELRGTLPVGFKYLLDASGRTIEAVLLFLRAKCAPFGFMRTRWTCATYAEHLYEWLTFLESIGVEWDSIKSSEIEAYAVSLGSYVSLHTKKRLKPTTRKGRLRTIVSFYRFAVERGFISIALGFDRRALDEPIPNDAGPAGKTIEETINGVVIPSSRFPICIPQDHLYKLFGNLGPTESNSRSDFYPSCRDRLAGEIALQGGLRLSEVTGLAKRQILALVPGKTPESPCALWITKTKRSVPRTIFLSSQLVSALHDYIDNERKAIVERARANDPEYVEPPELFLNTIDSNGRDLGKALKRENLMQRFAVAVKAAGFFTVEFATNPVDNEPYLKLEPAYSFHDLRHTFAYTMYYAFVGKDDAFAWPKVQVLLGHEQLETTKKFYLKGADLAEIAVSDALVQTFSVWTEFVIVPA